MIVLSQLILLAVTIIVAAWQAHLIKEIKPIKHGLWAFLYAVCCAIVIYFIKDDLKTTSIILTVIHYSLFIIAGSIIHLLGTNTFLNYFRHLNLLYMSQTSTSLLDKLEIKIFGIKGVWKFELGLFGVLILIQFIL